MCAANSRQVRAALASSLLLSCSKMSSLHSAGRASQPLPGTGRTACECYFRYATDEYRDKRAGHCRRL